MTVAYIKKQCSHIRAGGVKTLVSKGGMALRILFRQIFVVVSNVLTLPIVLIIVLIRPVCVIRFGVLTSHRIGHFAADTEAYMLSLQDAKSHRRQIDIVGCPVPACNVQLELMWRRNMDLCPGAWLWGIMDSSCQFWARGVTHHVKLYGRADDYNRVLNTPASLCFTPEEFKFGRALLSKLGIPSNADWVCIHNRDKSYLDLRFGGRWRYHDFRDFCVKDFVYAAEYLTERGYFVIRMGKVVEEELKIGNPKVIDYASSGLTSDFADIFLLANCKFHLGACSGIACVPFIFRRPTALINMIPISTITQFQSAPVIVKQVWDKNLNKYLSLRELFITGAADLHNTYQFEEAGLELKCNVPEEIRDLAIEVDNRLNGQWISHPKDDQLQERFWEIYRELAPNDLPRNVQARIGTAFLRKHQYLLD